MGIYESFPINDKYYGFRIYKLHQNSPLIPAGIKEIEDFIIPPKEVYELKIPFYEWIKLNSGKIISLEVYKLSLRHLKTVSIQIDIEGGIGATVRYENWSNAARNVLRVIKIKDNSWAETQLDLKPMEDYLIGFRPNNKDIVSLNQEDQLPFDILEKFIQGNIGEECESYIYNTKHGARIKKAKIDNNKHFELGCDAAYGKFHEFPLINDEDLENDDYSSEKSVDEKKPIKINGELNI